MGVPDRLGHTSLEFPATVPPIATISQFSYRASSTVAGALFITGRSHPCSVIPQLLGSDVMQMKKMMVGLMTMNKRLNGTCPSKLDINNRDFEIVMMWII
jgi:hypothetical protein